MCVSVSAFVCYVMESVNVPSVCSVIISIIIQVPGNVYVYIKDDV